MIALNGTEQHGRVVMESFTWSSMTSNAFINGFKKDVKSVPNLTFSPHLYTAALIIGPHLLGCVVLERRSHLRVPSS